MLQFFTGACPNAAARVVDTALYVVSTWVSVFQNTITN